MRFSSVLSAAALASLPLAAIADDTRIIVTGEGSVEAAPDMATITLGVTAQHKSARGAMDEVSTGVARLLERMVAADIAQRDMQTSGLSLGPIWDGVRYGSSGNPEIVGFNASNTVTVRVRDLPALGGLLDSLFEDGANSFSGLSFGLQDPRPALDDARRKAVADARAKAELYAEAAGVSLGRVVSISEEGGGAPPMPMYRMEAAMADSVPVAAGELAITARVTVVWEIGGL